MTTKSELWDSLLAFAGDGATANAMVKTMPPELRQLFGPEQLSLFDNAVLPEPEPEGCAPRGQG
jgi:hypothetical protein